MTWRNKVDRAINSMKLIAAGRETSRFAFDSYFGRRYLGYLGRITRLVSRAITISMAQITQKIFQSEIFTPKIMFYIVVCCTSRQRSIFEFNKSFLKISVYYFSPMFL